MTYPLSTPVTAGQPTAAAHYNNLLQDALYMGNSPDDSGLLGTLLSQYQSGLKLQYLATHRIRVPASSSAPVRLMVDGAVQSVTTNVDLPSGSVPTGPAATWYVFAVRAAGSTTFTLTINTSPTEFALSRLIGQFYWDGSAITRLQTLTRMDFFNQTGLQISTVCQGRLTLSSGNPAPINDITAASILYFTPFMGPTVALWETGSGWRCRSFSEISLNLSGLTANKNHDIFLADVNGVLTLEPSTWTDSTTRSVLLTLQDGIYVKSGDPTRRYLGTIRTTSVDGQCEDSKRKRLVWNLYNQMPRVLYVFENTNHTYSVETTRPWNNNPSCTQLETVFGLADKSLVKGETICQKYNTSGSSYYCAHAICMDSGGSVYSEGHIVYGAFNSQQYVSILAPHLAGLGYHTWYVNETSYGSSVYQNVYFNLLIEG